MEGKELIFICAICGAPTRRLPLCGATSQGFIWLCRWCGPINWELLFLCRQAVVNVFVN